MKKQCTHMMEHSVIKKFRNGLTDKFTAIKNGNFGLYGRAVLKETDKMIGQCGLTMQQWKDQEVLKSAICSKDHTGIRDMPLKRQKHVNNTHLKN